MVDSRRASQAIDALNHLEQFRAGEAPAELREHAWLARRFSLPESSKVL